MNTRLLNTFPAITLSAGLLLGALCTTQAQPSSPVGTVWDCTLSGKRSGIAYLSFSTNNNGTISGYEILVPQPIVSPHAVLVSSALPTNGLGVRPPAPAQTTNIYGGFPITGSWGFDSRGRIIGTFLEVVNGTTCVTNAVPVVTNTAISIASTSGSNAFEGGFCVTLPLATNMIPQSYIEQITCYATNVLLSTNSFESFDRLEATNAFADGHFCITVPIGTNAGNYVELVTCYAPLAPVSSNTFLSSVLITNVTESDGMTCVVLPVGTNMVPVSYVEQTICYVTQVNCVGTFTNAVNFTANAVSLKRLTLTGKASLGIVTMRGVPAVTLNDLTGAWYGTKRQSQRTGYEFFSLTNSLAEPNTYLVNGSGAGYTYSGVAALSSQKRIALALGVFDIDGSYQSTRAVVGPFNTRKLSGNTTGLDSPGGTTGLTNRVTFRLTKRATLP